MTGIRGFISKIMGGGTCPPVPPLSAGQLEAEHELTQSVQRAVSAQNVACKAIRDGNGRVIALLQESLGKQHGAS